MAREATIWDSDHIDGLLVESPDGGGAEITAFTPGKELTVKLDARGIRQLRLELQRLERATRADH